jgi:hypothetical protein
MPQTGVDKIFAQDTKPQVPIAKPLPTPTWKSFPGMENPREPFDMRGTDRSIIDRFTYVDISPREGSLTGSSVQPISSDSTPIDNTPETLQQFDPEKFFGEMNLSSGSIDIVMNMGQDDGVEFFSDMLGGN